MTFLERLQWRYATKKMNPAKAVPAAAVERIVEAIRLAPSSRGLQPYELVVVWDPAVRAKLRAAANGQSQIEDATCVVVFASWASYTPERVNAYFDRVAEVRGAGESVEKARAATLALASAESTSLDGTHAAKQAYLGLGVGLAAAALEGVDSTPMEGFDPAKVEEILGLSARGLRATALMAIGHRDEASDWLLALPKVRRTRASFVTDVRP
jgi:nitroreductase / dihydropteridine reductase